ncbi:MAG TPA: Lrp/AsnC family transcriptional regulator [Ktedonobacterales bacterium]|jgi:Lrp/AsnC family leucine-responsive transcriptional regulator
MITFDTDKLMDATGWQILQALQEDARVSFSELGRRVGLSAPAVAERVRRLEEAGVISGYHAQVNMEKIGLTLSAFIRVSLSHERKVLLSVLAKDLPEVLECHSITGDDCLIMKVVVSSVTHLEELLHRLGQFGRTTTSVVLSSPVTRRTIGAPCSPAVESGK